MSRFSKNIKYVTTGIIGLAILSIIVKTGADNKYMSQLPVLIDLQTLSAPFQEQVTDALKTARFNPTARNLGRLGMVFHSAAFYDKASHCYKLAIKKCYLYFPVSFRSIRMGMGFFRNCQYPMASVFTRAYTLAPEWGNIIRYLSKPQKSQEYLEL